jgi:ATP-binding cassette, subfamily F, member 3
MSQEVIRTVLAAFLFTGDDSDKKVKVLSGGEKSRLILAKLLIDPPNFLLLDEPTTHLDVDAVDALIKALNSYEGTIVFISHDIHFVRSVANTVFEVKDGAVRKFFGNFDYYLEKKEKPGALPQPGHRAGIKQQEGQDIKVKKENEESKHKEEETKRKFRNFEIKEKIKKLNSEKESLNLEYLAKKRAVENPRSYRDNDSLEQYIQRIQEIEQRFSEISEEIRGLKKQIEK